MVTAVLVGLGGAAGAVLRYLIDRRLRRAGGSAFPWGTLTANVAGCALLGLLTGWALAGHEPGTVHSLLGVGLCGSLTTFSTFGYETVRLAADGARRHAVTNVVLTVCAGFGAAAAGILTGVALCG